MVRRKEKKKMNKQKTLTIIEKLENIIKSKKETSEYKVAKLYIDTWVIGTLEEIKTKINGVDVPYMVRETTYPRLFLDFVNLYFCRNINPNIKVYAIAVLFDIETRDLIIDLYQHLFDKTQRNTDSRSCGYIEFEFLSNESKFEVIRCAYGRQGAC